jgi:hypothetical protein
VLPALPKKIDTPGGYSKTLKILENAYNTII